MSIIYSCDDSNIVGVTSGIGISLRESIGNLTNGVSFRITVSLTLAIVSTISTTIGTTIGTTIARVSTVTNGTISRYSPMSIIYSCDDSNIVGVTSGIGISLRESIGNLTKSVSIRITVSLTLAI